MSSIIGYENLIETASTVTVTSEAAGYEKANAYDWLENDYWQGTAAGTRYYTVDLGSAKTVDYWACHAHDLSNNAGLVRVQYSSDNFAADVNEYGGNLLNRSEGFNQSEWTQTGTPVITVNTEPGPDGTQAPGPDKIEDDDAAGFELISQSGAAFHVSDDFTASVYVKKDTTPRTTRFVLLRLQFGSVATEPNDVKLDTSTGEVNGSLTDGGGSVGVQAVGDWWRVHVTAANQNGSNTSVTVQIYPAAGASATWVNSTGATGSATFWGAQLEKRSSVGLYQATPPTGIVLDTGPSVSARYWRFRFDDVTTASKIGVLSLGKRLDLPVGMRVGFTPPHHGAKYHSVPQMSESGLFIGRSIRRTGYETTINLTNVTPAWVRQSLQPFIEHAKTKPFFFLWDDEVHTWETAYCWLAGDPQISYSGRTWMEVSLPIRASL